MHDRRVRIGFFIALSTGVMALVFFIFLPFLSALTVAVSLAILLWPVRVRLMRAFRGQRTFAALTTVVAASILLLIPATLLGYELFRESSRLYAQASSGSASVASLSKAIEGPIRQYYPDFSFDLGPGAQNVFKWLFDHLGTIFSSTLQTALEAFVAVIAFYYFLKDGERFRRKLMELSPLPDEEDAAILDKLVATINSVLIGTLLVSILQGVLAGIGFAMFGIPDSTLWGSLAAISSLIPGFGTSLVLVPGIVYLFLTGKVVAGLGLTIWSATAVGLVDNLLRPYLVGRGVRIHPLLVLISVLGGIDLFGALGFLIGPVVLSLMFALLDLYFAAYTEKPAAARTKARVRRRIAR